MRLEHMDTPGVEDAGQQTARLSTSVEGSSAAALSREATCSTLSVAVLAAQYLGEIDTYRRGQPGDETYGLELARRATIQGDMEHDLLTDVECDSKWGERPMLLHPRLGRLPLDKVVTYRAHFLTTTLRRRGQYAMNKRKRRDSTNHSSVKRIFLWTAALVALFVLFSVCAGASASTSRGAIAGQPCCQRYTGFHLLLEPRVACTTMPSSFAYAGERRGVT